MKKIIKKIIQIIVLITLIIFITICGLGYLKYKKAIIDVSIDKKILEIQSKENYIRYDDISENLIHATIAIEDKRFYTHHGIDFISLTRAFINNLQANEITSGGSTITQQLAKNLYFDCEPNYIRKISEIFMARDLEKKLSKNEIIELYINIINYGDNNFGVYEACKNYFHKYPKYLTMDEAALLAGIPQSPRNYQLSDHYKQALSRQKQVIQAMIDQNMIKEN